MSPQKTFLVLRWEVVDLVEPSAHSNATDHPEEPAPEFLLHSLEEGEQFVHVARALLVQVFGVHPLPVAHLRLERELQRFRHEQQWPHLVSRRQVIYFLIQRLKCGRKIFPAKRMQKWSGQEPMVKSSKILIFTPKNPHACQRCLVWPVSATVNPICQELDLISPLPLYLSSAYLCVKKVKLLTL